MPSARELTPAGIARAREVLADSRAHPTMPIVVPHALLFDPPFSAEVPNAPQVLSQPFESRRAAAAYFTPLLASARSRWFDHYGMWSWLGMYFLRDNIRMRDGRVDLFSRDESYVIFSDESQSERRRYLHYLWSAWQVAEVHPDATYILDRPLMDQSDIVDRVFSYPRLFNSVAIVQLILRLYADGTNSKPLSGRSRGGLRHLIRVLDQLERTHDIYGMTLDQLLSLLPADFDRWKSGG